MATCIAVIDDETVILDLLREVLREKGYAVHTFSVGTAAFSRVRALAPDAIILDIRLENTDAGWNLLDLCRHDSILGRTPIIVCSADLAAQEERRADVEWQGHVILVTPYDLDDLLALLVRVSRTPRDYYRPVRGRGGDSPTTGAGHPAGRQPGWGEKGAPVR